MEFEMIEHDGDCAVRIRDTWDDVFDIRLSGHDLEVTWGAMVTNALIDRDGARVLSRILARYAEDGDLSGARMAIDGAGENPPPQDGTIAAMQDRIDELEGRYESWAAGIAALERRTAETEKVLTTVEESCPPRVGERLDMCRDQQNALATQLAEIRERLEAAEQTIKCQHAILTSLQRDRRPCEPSPEPETPEQRAAEMSRRFPVGATVRFKPIGGGSLRDNGVIASGFAAPGGEPYLVWVRDPYGFLVAAIHVEPRD